jgi:hypothetical protein
VDFGTNHYTTITNNKSSKSKEKKMTKTANYNRGYEKQLLERGGKLYPRNIEIPEGCWMCGETRAKLTKARLFPDWMLEAFNCGDEMYLSAHLSATGQLIDKREIPFKRLVCGQVCQNCIHGWIDELDNDFKELFLGDTGKALDEQPLLIARWAAKTATLINISQQRRVQVPSAARHGLSDKTTMPKGWSAYAFTCSTEGLTPIGWTQGGPALAMFGNSDEEQEQLTVGSIFACTMKFSNFGVLVYWQPENVYHLEPANPFKRLWPQPAGSLTDEAWHPYMAMFVADVSGNRESWTELLTNARAKAADPGIDVYDFNQ